MTLLGLVLLIILLGAGIAIVRLLPIDGTMKQIAVIVIVVAFVLFLANAYLGGGHVLNPRLW